MIFREEILADGVRLICGDCREVLKELPAASVDACVTDPPYGLEFMGKEWDSFGRERSYKPRSADGYGNKGLLPHYGRGGTSAEREHFRRKVNNAFQVFTEEWAREVFRVLKPGAHLLAFGGTRTYHRLACAIEDAGFEIRDCVMWVYGSGFPKSLNVSKAIDKAAGAERTEIVGSKLGRPGMAKDGSNQRNGFDHAFGGDQSGPMSTDILAPATDAARQWNGWGTALKPSCEPIVLARKPLIGTVAENVLAHGTGAINVDGCRVSTEARPLRTSDRDNRDGVGNFQRGSRATGETEIGRWPANLIHDGSAEVVEAFPDAPGQLAAVNGSEPSSKTNNVYGQFDGRPATSPRGDSGSAARFFYTAKADTDDRLGSKHPTVKPLDLMQYLVRLITPKGGVVLDCFAGTGTTGEAAFREGMRAVLIEREPEYQADIRRRMSLVLGGQDERRHAAIKASGKVEDPGPLFAQALK